MARYKKRPDIVEAVQYNGILTDEIKAFTGRVLQYGRNIDIPSRHGPVSVHPGWYIVKDRVGDFHSYSEGEFGKIYASIDHLRLQK